MLIVKYSNRMTPLIGFIFGAIPAAAAIRLGDGLLNPWLLALSLVLFGVGAAIGAWGVAHSVTRIDARGLARREGNGNFRPFKRLGRDERFVIDRRCLCILRPDGTLEKTEVAKWRLRREDWVRVASEYPDRNAAPTNPE